MLTLLLSMCIGVLKTAHDSGRSKVWFIGAMIIAGLAICGDTNHWLTFGLFLAPLLFYVQETGYLHKLNKTNTLKADWKLWGYAYLITLCFMAPFTYTNPVYSLPLLLWPILLRNLVMANSKWWWVCTFCLFFSYSLLYLSLCQR